MAPVDQRCVKNLAEVNPALRRLVEMLAETAVRRYLEGEDNEEETPPKA